MIPLLWACTATHTPPEGAATEAPAAATAPVASAPAHPGAVLFLDRDNGSSHTEKAEDIPATIAWYEHDGQRVPVVRIESTEAAGVREIFRYGPDGALLDVTTSAPPPRQ